MKPELIVMLTHHDRTVPNAIQLFDEVKEIPVTHWGFKDIGLYTDQMATLVRAMRNAGKTTFLEVVSLSEEEGLAGAKLATELGIDILMGTVFYDSINDFLQDKRLKYFPFPGNVHSHPSILDGSIEQVVQHTLAMQDKGVDGFDLLTYRYTGDAPCLLREVVNATHLPVVSAGSIADFQRIQTVQESGAWGFTIGSAFFEKKFVPDGDFKDNVLAVWDWLERHQQEKK